MQTGRVAAKILDFLVIIWFSGIHSEGKSNVVMATYKTGVYS